MLSEQQGLEGMPTYYLGPVSLPPEVDPTANCNGNQTILAASYPSFQ